MQAGSRIVPSDADWPFSDLLFRELTRIELIDPWRLKGRAVGVVGRSLLAGAMALHFGDVALVCTSPLRYSFSDCGSRLAALGSGGMLSLGYRINVVDCQDVDLVLPSGATRMTLTAKDLRAHDLLDSGPSLVLLQGVHESEDPATICLRLLGSNWLHLSYRRDLDGAIEFAPSGVHHQLASITVGCAEDEFGWLHPAAQFPFVLEGLIWRSAHPRDWPWPVIQALRGRGSADQRTLHNATLARATSAKIMGSRILRNRWKALSGDPEIDGVPTNLLKAVRRHIQEWNAEQSLLIHFQTDYI